MKKKLVFLLTTALCMAFAVTAFAGSEVPKKKQTSLGLYLTAKQAYETWQAAPDEIKVLDVRTTGEYVFVGHAPMAVNIPLRFLEEGVNSLTLKLKMPGNDHFIEQVKDKFKTTDTILVMCRSGSRSAAAVNAMAKAGFTKVYNIIDGFEGGALKMQGSYNNGKRLVNGWKNSGAPWTYSLDRGLVYTK